MVAAPCEQADANARKRSQRKGKLMGKTAWTKRSRESGRFIDVKKSKKKFKGVRREDKASAR
jgi:hypothetical protein